MEDLAALKAQVAGMDKQMELLEALTKNTADRITADTTFPTHDIEWSYVDPVTSSSLKPHTSASTRSGEPSPM